METSATTAKLYWTWNRESGLGLTSIEVPLEDCERELQLSEATPLGSGFSLSGKELAPDYVVLEVSPWAVSSELPPGFYRLVERRYDQAIQRLLKRA